MHRVTHFDISADDADRAIRFYENVFGWKFNKWDGPMNYWLISTGDGPGIDGGLGLKSESQMPDMNTIEVPSADDCIAKVQDSGGKILAPKRAIPGVGWFAAFEDTEGNKFGLMEANENAK